MSRPPPVLVNTILETENEYFIDTISSIAIHLQALIGLNRIPLLHNYFNIYNKTIERAALIYSIASVVTVFSLTVYFTDQLVADVFEYVVTAAAGFVTYKRLRLFYITIAHFDRQVNCRPKTKYILKNNKLLYITFFVTTFSVIYRTWELGLTLDSGIYTIFRLMHKSELFMYGHLFSLLCPRIKLINQLMTQTLSDDGSSSGDHVMQINKDDFEQSHGPPCSLGKICLFVDLYKTLINACNNLVNAIKYQVGTSMF